MSDNLTRDEARERAGLVSDPRYHVTLDFTRDEASFPSETVIRFRCSDPGAETFLDFSATDVGSLTLNGEDLPPAAFDGRRIRLPSLREENEVRVVATVIDHRTGKGVVRVVDPVDDLPYIYTDLEPFDAHLCFPCFDQPDIKGTFEFAVLAPQGWEVLSNNPALEPREAEGGMLWTFARTPSIPTYITAIVAGPYHVVRDRHGDIDLGVYCRRSLAEHLDPHEIIEVTKQGFDHFAEAFGYPYPFEKYDQVFVPDYRAGAMENAGCVTFNEQRYVFRSRVTQAARELRGETILHEMAHMWFGDLVTMRWWDDLWLNETFATYVSVRAMALATRFRDAWTTFADSEKAWAYEQDQLPTTHPISADVPDTDSIHLNFDGITYAKGASVLKQLVAWVGEDNFLEGVRRYFPRYEWGTAELADFLSVLEEVSHRDLGTWSKEWLQAAGVNTLRSELEADGDGRIASFAVAQEAPAEWPTLRSHRVAVGLYDPTADGLTRRSRVELDVTGPRTEVPDLAGQRVPGVILLNDDDLTYAKVRLDPGSLSTILERLSDIEEPLARALCWSTAWDMTRDGELPVGRFLQLVMDHAERETNVGVLQRLVGASRWGSKGLTAVNVYGDPSARRDRLTRLAGLGLSAVREAEPGGDRQLTWARAFVSAATTEQQLGTVRGLLEGKESIEGLPVDTEFRWHIVGSLAAAGADDGLIEAEEERDPTDLGARHARTARAARPTADAKAEAWTKVVDDPSTPVAMMEDLIAGFQQPGQMDLLTPYVDRYFEALPRVWESRELPGAIAFGQGMYPYYVVEQAVIEATDRVLGDGDVPGPLRRILLEGKDGILRAMRTREADRAARGGS